MDDVLDKLSAVKVLNAIPAPIFIVDRDATVHALNSAARKFVGPEADRSLHRRCGEVLGCMNQHAKPERCGETERCGDAQEHQRRRSREAASRLSPYSGPPSARCWSTRLSSIDSSRVVGIDRTWFPWKSWQRRQVSHLAWVASSAWVGRIGSFRTAIPSWHATQ